MTTPASPANGPESLTFAEIRALLSETVMGLVETRKIVDENTRDIAEMRAAITDLAQAQNRTNNGRVIPAVAGTDISPATHFRQPFFNVAYVPIQNGNQLTNPPEYKE